MAPSQSSAISEVIDVDAINLDSDEIEYRGYRRDDTKEMHTLEFEREGVLYMGHHDQKNWELRRKLLAAQQKVLKPVGHLERATSSANEQGLRAVTAPLSTGDAASDLTLDEQDILQSISLQRRTPSLLKIGPPRGVKRQKTANGSSAASIPPVHSTSRKLGSTGNRLCEIVRPVERHRGRMPLAIHQELTFMRPILTNIANAGSIAKPCTSAIVRSRQNSPNDSALPPLDEGIGLREDEDLIIHMHVLGLPSIAVNNSSAPGQGVAHATQCLTEANATSYRGNQFIWDKLRQCSARMRQSRTTYRSRGRFDMLTDLREIDHAPGHIQKIVQYEGLIGVASTVSDGMWGNSNRPLDHYNSGGALKVSMKGALHTLPAHMQRRRLRGREEIQHYSLNDIQFNPTVPGRLVSVGTDRKLQVWDCLGLQDNRELSPVRTVTYSCAMGAVLFKPKEALLAMAGWDG